MHLAYAKMYILVADIFRRFGSREVCFESGEGVPELFETRGGGGLEELFLLVLRKGDERIRFKFFGGRAVRGEGLLLSMGEPWS
jgi:hypothetical protein